MSQIRSGRNLLLGCYAIVVPDNDQRQGVESYTVPSISQNATRCCKTSSTYALLMIGLLKEGGLTGGALTVTLEATRATRLSYDLFLKHPSFKILSMPKIREDTTTATKPRDEISETTLDQHLPAFGAPTEGGEHFRRLLFSCDVFTPYLLLAFSWLFLGPHLLDKTMSMVFFAFFVGFLVATSCWAGLLCGNSLMGSSGVP